MWVIEALRVPISYLLLNLVSLNSRYVFREWGDICEEDPTPLFYNMDSFKMLLYWAVFFFRNCAGSWYFYLLPLHLHQVTLLSGPGHLCFRHQQVEGEQTSPTRNSCAKYALSKIWMSRCFAPLDRCGQHSVPLKGEAQTKSWLKLFVYSSIWPEGMKYMFWHTFIPM